MQVKRAIFFPVGTGYSDRENEFKCKPVLIRKVTNFIEKNECRLVYTEHASCSIT